MLFMSRLGLEDEDDDGEEDMEDREVVVFGVLGELTGERDNERAGILIFLIVGLDTRCWLILVVVVELLVVRWCLLSLCWLEMITT